MSLRLFVARLSVELRTIESAILVAGTAAAALVAAATATTGAGATARSPLSAAVVLLAALWPVLATTPAAIVAARDAEARLFERVGWHQLANVRETAIAVGAASSAVIVVVGLLIASSYAGLAAPPAGSTVPSRAGELITAMVVTLPVWALVGAAVGARLGTRAASLVTVGALVLSIRAVEQLATKAPVAQWIYAATPAGLQDVVTDGLSSTAIPRLGSPLVPIAGALLLSALAAISLARTVPLSSRTHVRSGRHRRRPAPLVLVLAVAPLIGLLGPPVLEAALPWQLSPRWLVDQATGRTPDAALRDLITALRERGPEGARGYALEGDLERALGRYGAEFSPPPSDVSVEARTRAETAGEVGLIWTSRFGGGRGVLACMSRQASGWKLVAIIDVGLCPRSVGA